MLQKVKERLMMWGYSFTAPEPETPAAADPETAEESEALDAAEDPAETAEADPTPDELMIQFLIDKTEAHIKNYCNIKEVPEELEKSEIDMVAIEFLKDKALAGGLDTTSLKVDAISSISEGDVSVSYASGSAVTLPNMFKSISEQFQADLIPFRRLRW